MVKVLIKRLSSDVKLPSYKTSGASGMDLMAFIKSPDGISVELLQKGKPLPAKEPWKSQSSVGSW